MKYMYNVEFSMTQMERRIATSWHSLKYLPAVKIHINYTVIYNLVATHTI
jgi:hypothetical protein